MQTLSKALALLAALSFQAASATASTNNHVAFSGDLPPLQTQFETWDVCQQVDDLIDKLGLASNFVPRLCDFEMEQSFAIGVAKVSIAGTLEQLVVRDGFIGVDGTLDATVELSPLRVEGGRAPVFSPCDRGDFPGCVQPPSGDALEALFDQSPMVSVELPAPNRVCIPGMPVRVKEAELIPGRRIAGRRVGRTWHPPRWIPARREPAVYETCRITDWGALPTVTTPEVERVVVDVYPHVVADMGLSIAGDGSIEVEIPIPYAGAKAGYGNKWVDLELGTGAFLLVTLQVNDAGADAYLAFDQDLHIQLTYDKGAGWSQQATVLRNEMAPALVPHGADVTIRAALKLGFDAAAKVGIPGSDGDSDAGESSEPDADDSADADEDAGDIALPDLPVDENVQCAAEWAVNGADLEVGVELSASLELFVEGTYPLFSEDDDVAFEVDAGLELAHAESVSFPGLCEIGCETLAGDGDPMCEPVELFRAEIAAL